MLAKAVATEVGANLLKFQFPALLESGLVKEGNMLKQPCLLPAKLLEVLFLLMRSVEHVTYIFLAQFFLCFKYFYFNSLTF